MRLLINNCAVEGIYPDSQTITAQSSGGLVLTVPDGIPVEIGQTWEVGLDVAQAARIEEATAVCNAVLSPLGVEYGRWETATWDQQYAEATALMADPTTPVPLIAALATARGMDVAVLAQRIIRNRETWSVLTGAVIGQRLAIVDRINACATVADVLAVDMTISLPG